jgi:hypothetical protein
VDDALLRQAVTLPAAEIYVTWGFSTPLERLEWDLTVHLDPGERCGQYLALYSGAIDGFPCYLGLQTDVVDPRTGRGTGKGLIFSTWWSFDAADVRVADDGFIELGTHEGYFVGVRRPYAWGAGDYRVTLARGEGDIAGRRPLDWFDLSIERLAPLADAGRRPDRIGEPTWIGAIRFPRRRRRRPAQIDPGQLFLEVYSNARRWDEVPPLDIDIMAFGEGQPCPSGMTEYPRPYGKDVPIADAHYVADRGRIALVLSQSGSRHPAARWP